MQRAEILFGSYRRGDANDPERYVGSIAAVLSLYDPDLIREVTDPRTGIQTTDKHASFMPNAGELKRYCEGVAAHRERMTRLAAVPRPVPADRRLAAPPAAPGSFANVFVPEGHRRYAGLQKWAETADPKFWRYGPSSDGRPGLWVAYNVWDAPQPAMQRTKSDPDWSSLKLKQETLDAMSQRIEPESETDAA